MSQRRGSAGIKSYAWQKLSRTLITQAHNRGDSCALCGRPLRPHAPPRSRWSSVADHITPRKHGGTNDLWNLQPAHLICNTIKENDSRKGQKQPIRRQITHSRDW